MAGDHFDQILQYIRANPECRRADISEHLRDIPPPTLARYLQQLVAEGELITRKERARGKGRPALLYSIPVEL